MANDILFGIRGTVYPVEEVCKFVGNGWEDIIRRLVVDLFELGWDGTLLQIKEKFGGLRFYIGGGTSAIFDRINEAEQESVRTCERCGEKGKTVQYHGWLTTLCEKCSESCEGGVDELCDLC